VSVRLRPAYALAAAAVVAVLAASALDTSPTPGGPAGASAAPTVFVQFRLDYPDASHVQLAGTFSNWERQHDLHQVAPGVWTITLPLQPGVHDHSFIVDGERWMADPYAPAIHDGFGGMNSRLSLVVPSGPRS
jgi:1,4-alpha-glucan branching enzyme